jgi:hypothetical protein
MTGRSWPQGQNSSTWTAARVHADNPEAAVFLIASRTVDAAGRVFSAMALVGPAEAVPVVAAGGWKLRHGK